MTVHYKCWLLSHFNVISSWFIYAGLKIPPNSDALGHRCFEPNQRGLAVKHDGRFPPKIGMSMWTWTAAKRIFEVNSEFTSFTSLAKDPHRLNIEEMIICGNIYMFTYYMLRFKGWFAADAASSEMNLLNLPIVIDHPRRFTALDVLGLSSVGLSTKAQQTHQATRSDFLLSHSWGHGMIKGAVISLLTIFLCWVWHVYLFMPSFAYRRRESLTSVTSVFDVAGWWAKAHHRLGAWNWMTYQILMG